VLDVDETDYGYRYAGIRSVGPESQYVRAYHFVLPFTQLRPGSAGIERIPTFVSGHHWVPIDDYNCMVWNWHYSYGDDELTEQYRTMDRDGDSDRFVNRHDQFRAYGNRRNDWLIDREAQKNVSFTGIAGIHAQDRAVQESMGLIVQREREHLGPADRAIIVARRILLDEVQAVAAGRTPRGLSESYYNLRSIERIFPKDEAWRDVLLPLMYPEQRGEVEAAVG
jgi:hypothetical protein